MSEFKFADFNISAEPKHFTGKKISMFEVLNQPIKVLAFKEAPSNYKEKIRIDIHIEFEGEKRLLWSNSVFLRDMINKVPSNGFPFTTTIKKVEECLKFT